MQVCGRCGHSWYPRGHWRSPKCPQCGAIVPTAAPASSSSSSKGCWTVVLVLFGVVVLTNIAAAAGAATAGGVLAVLVAGWIGVVLLKRRATRKADEEQRRLVAAREQEQRQLAATQTAEHERQLAERFQGLVQRFGQENAGRIMSKTLWQGATAEMVHAMLGAPENVASKVLKTKKRDVWKYNRIGARRYGLQVTLENDVCVGWETAGDS